MAHKIEKTSTETRSRSMSEPESERQSPPPPQHPARFRLVRDVDVTGISGEGHVADGVLWPDGTASVRWRGEHPSVVFWDRGRVSVQHIHGHGGLTRIEWVDASSGRVEAGCPGSGPGGQETDRLTAAVVDSFNAHWPVGTPVRYWTGWREGEGKPTQTRSVAFLLGGRTPVVWVTGESSCIALTHVEPSVVEETGR